MAGLQLNINQGGNNKNVKSEQGANIPSQISQDGAPNLDAATNAVDLQKVGETVKSVIKSNDATRVQVLFNGKMNYDALDTGQGVDFKANNDNKDFVNFANIDVERNGTVNVHDNSEYAFKN